MIEVIVEQPRLHRVSSKSYTNVLATLSGQLHITLLSITIIFFAPLSVQDSVQLVVSHPPPSDCPTALSFRVLKFCIL